MNSVEQIRANVNYFNVPSTYPVDGPFFDGWDLFEFDTGKERVRLCLQHEQQLTIVRFLVIVEIDRNGDKEVFGRGGISTSLDTDSIYRALMDAWLTALMAIRYKIRRQ